MTEDVAHYKNGLEVVITARFVRAMRAGRDRMKDANAGFVRPILDAWVNNGIPEGFQEHREKMGGVVDAFEKFLRGRRPKAGDRISFEQYEELTSAVTATEFYTNLWEVVDATMTQVDFLRSPEEHEDA